MRVEARIAGKKKERKMGWSTKAVLVLFVLAIALLVSSYMGSCSTNQSDTVAGAYNNEVHKEGSL